MPSRYLEIALPTGGVLPAFFAPAEGAGSAAGIVLLQEIFGVNANMREIASSYASRGVHAVVPDLFWRQQPGVDLDPGSAADRERATQLMQGLDTGLAVGDALAAANYLRALPGATGRVGAVGYCLGGKLAVLAACHAGIDAAVSYYGVGIQASLDKANEVRCPLLLHIAEEDHLCPPAAQAAIQQAFAPQPGATVMAYPGVGHAFARRGGAAFNAAAAERADGATWAFLALSSGA